MTKLLIVHLQQRDLEASNAYINLMIIILEVVEGPEAGRTFTVNDGQSCLIGRVTGDLTLEKDPLISGRHLSITNDGGKCYVEDLESRNHVFVEGKQIPTSVPIAVGNKCHIKAGTTTVLQVNLLPNQPSQQPDPDVAILTDKLSGFETINEPTEKRGNLVQKDQVSNFGFDVDSIEIKEEDFRGGTNIAPSHAKKTEQASESPFDKKTSPFDFGDDAPSLDSPRSDKPIDSKKTATNQSNDIHSKEPPARSKTSNNFSESIYIPGQGNSSSIPAVASSERVSPLKKTTIEFDRIISEDGIFVIGGITKSDDAATAASEFLERISKLGTIVCLTHSFENPPVDDGISPPDDGIDKNSLNPTSDLIRDGEPQISTTPLFDWLPKEVAATAGPVMISSGDLPNFEDINSQQWGTNSIMWLMGDDEQSIFNHMKSVIRMDLKSGKQADGVLGICWPIILSSILDGKDASSVSKIFGKALQGILFEDPDEKFAWRFASTVDLTEKLSGLSIQESQKSR